MTKGGATTEAWKPAASCIDACMHITSRMAFTFWACSILAWSRRGSSLSWPFSGRNMGDGKRCGLAPMGEQLRCRTGGMALPMPVLRTCGLKSRKCVSTVMGQWSSLVRSILSLANVSWASSFPRDWALARGDMGWPVCQRTTEGLRSRKPARGDILVGKPPVLARITLSRPSRYNGPGEDVRRFPVEPSRQSLGPLSPGSPSAAGCLGDAPPRDSLAPSRASGLRPRVPKPGASRGSRLLSPGPGERSRARAV